MAWLSDLAGKAENILNKIDKNTAAVLSKDKNDTGLPLTDVPWTPSHDSSSLTVTYTPTNTTNNSPRLIRSSQSTNSNPQPFMNKEEKLITYLNSPTSTPVKKFINDSILNTSSAPLLFSMDHDNDKDATSEYSTHSSESSIKLQHTLVNVPDVVDQLFTSDDNPSNIYTENMELKSEIDKLQHEFLIANHVEKSIENQQNELKHEINDGKQKNEYKLNQKRAEINYLLNNNNPGSRRVFNMSQKKLEEQNEILCQQHTDNQKEIEKLKEQLQMHEIDIIQYVKQISDLQSVLERTRSDLQSTRQELEQHRARALKTLQEKEKLIGELKNNNLPIGFDSSTTNMEINQLRQECNVLRQENQQLCEQVKLAREELVNADMKIEESNRRIVSANKEAYEIISNEKKLRTDTEEDARIHLEETHKLKDELATQLNNWSVKLQKQESEILRLKSQLSAVSTPSSAVETRLSTLTQTLVSKQNELERLTTEKNALRLQLERIEHEYRRHLTNARKGYNVNDTDDAKAQVPTFLMETPFDTGVTRRVKRAYSSLDAISVRIGLFLRRYPLARIFVIIYIAFLQLWVLVVLLFQSPDVH